MNLKQIQIIHEAAAEGDLIGSANLALAADGIDDQVTTRSEAILALRTLEANLAAENKFLEIASLLWGNKMFDSRPQAVRDVFEAVINHHKLIILGASSMSKCLGPDVKVLMFDGTVKAAKDVKKGDVLMGDDSTPRNVLDAHSGYGPMYKITPERGEPWTCNDEHILSLKVTSPKKCGSGVWSKKWIKGDVKDVPLKEYLTLSKDKKNRLKQFHVGVEFPEKPLPFDPYIYGAWLGDGCATIPSLHTPDGPMARRWCEYWNTYPGMKAVSLKQKPGKCPAWRASKSTTAKGPNPFSEFMATSVRNGVKFIREEYLINSRENRLKLLAGLLDSDGWVEPPNKTCFGFVTKSKQFAIQVSWLARSLGFASNVFPREHTIRSINFCGTYWHTRISGVGVSEIPTIEKRATDTVAIKDLLNTSFTVEPIGKGHYYGFLIDGNHRFLLGDFTVTHNTFSCGVLYLLYWRNDPYWTAIKLAGPSEVHLYGNLFSHIVALHRSSVIPMTEDDARMVNINETDMFISMRDAIPEMRIQCVLCKQNQISATGLRGHKPKPYRTEPHPKLGKMTRIYILIDEGTHVSPGAYNDIKTTEASINPDTDSVKIVMACNPEGIDYRIVELAEPEGGWDIEQVDTLFKWKSAKGYNVLRLDGARSENVIERKIIYEGLMSYDVYLDFLKSGEHSGPYWAKGRGFPPLKDNAWTILPISWAQSQRGEPIYIGKVTAIASIDTALGGGDKALLGVGRWGEAAGWRDIKGETIWFVNRADPDKRITKHVMVLDQIFQLPKTDNTVEIMQEVMGRCKQLGVEPFNVAMDKGGNAAGVWSHAKKYWGDVLGVDSGERASEEKVLADDQMVAYDIYERTATELWYIMRRWIDPIVNAILINPIVPTQPMFTQLTTRRYRNIKGNRIQVEPKHEWRVRNQGQSPDEADILNLMAFWCHKRGGVLPGVMETPKDVPEDSTPISVKTVDEPDSLDEGKNWEGGKLAALWEE